MTMLNESRRQMKALAARLQLAKNIWVEHKNHEEGSKIYQTGKNLLSPTQSRDGRDYYSFMHAPVRGDAVIHIKELKPKHRFIFGVSSINTPAVKNRGRYRIELTDFIQIEKIPLEEFLSRHGKSIRAEIERGKNIELYPFRRKKDSTDEVTPAQKYLTRATPHLVELFMGAIVRRQPKRKRKAGSATGKDGGGNTSAPTQGLKHYLVNFEAKVSPRHHELQDRFEKWLEKSNADLRRNINFVDLRFKRGDSRSVFAEIKPCDAANVRYAIRTAIGQLLDYAHKESTDHLLIVVEVEPSLSDRDLAHRNNFGIAFPVRGGFEIAWPDTRGGASDSA